MKILSSFYLNVVYSNLDFCHLLPFAAVVNIVFQGLQRYALSHIEMTKNSVDEKYMETAAAAILSGLSTKPNTGQLIQRPQQSHQLVMTCKNNVQYIQSVDLEIIV